MSNEQDVLTDVSSFLSRYLHCSHHQRTVLALWILHTYCADAAQVTPYLSVQSAHKQSGKTLCLHLLQLLCNFPALATGFPASQLNKLLNGPNCTFLIDECQATLGTRTRSKAPTLRAFLTSGFQRDPELLGSLYGPNAFRPKVFAGMGQLPEPIADRSIPIVLNGIEKPGNQGVSSDAPISRYPDVPILRFNLRQATADAKSLREQLRNWAKDHLPALKESDPYPEDAFPPNLSPRRQDMIEPLLQLADAVGAQWPARIREAVSIIFEEGAAFDLQPSLQVLSELHRCFFHYGFPDRISTSVLIEWLQAVPNRPWETEGQINAARLARLLYPFEVRPRVLRMGMSMDKHGRDQDKSNFARGYLLEDFLDPCRRHLNFIVPGKTRTAPPIIGLESSAPNTKESNLMSAIELIEAVNRSQHVATNQDAAHETQSKITNQNSKISANGGHCDAVTHDVSTSNGQAKIAPQPAKADEKILHKRSNPSAKNRVNGVPM